MTDGPQEQGRLIARFRPWSLGLNVGAMPISASWPMARLDVFERGVRVTVIGREVWISRGDVFVVARSAGGIRIEWDGGIRTNAAFVMAFRRTRLLQALDGAGFEAR